MLFHAHRMLPRLRHADAFTLTPLVLFCRLRDSVYADADDISYAAFIAFMLSMLLALIAVFATLMLVAAFAAAYFRFCHAPLIFAIIAPLFTHASAPPCLYFLYLMPYFIISRRR